MPLTFNQEKKCRKYHLGEEGKSISLSSNPESKSLNKKSLNGLSSFSCSKRPRRDESNGFNRKARDDDLVTKKIGYDLVRCISSEKCQIVKQKRTQDGKRMDKSCKTSIRTKFHLSTSKAGFISSCSSSGGITINDLHDITNHVEELSLNELLDINFKYPNLSPEKKKKASNGNENILLSVRKALSILPGHGVSESSGNRGALISLQEPILSLANMKDGDETDRCIEELSCKDACLAELSTSSLYQPKDILECLALSPTLDLEALISNLNLSQSTTRLKDFYASSSPSCLRSLSHGGNCKPGLDSCKLIMLRSACQSKWVRIGNNCFSNLGMGTFYHNYDCTNQRKTDQLQDVKLLSESIMPVFDEPQQTSEFRALDPSSSCSLNSRKLELLDGHTHVSHNHGQGDSKDYLFRHNSDPEAGLRCLGYELNLVDSSKFKSPDSVVGLQEHLEKTADDCSQSCHGYSSKMSTDGCGQSLWHSSVREISTPGNSPQLLAAAAILCEMTRRSNGIRAQFDTFTSIKRKSTSSLEKSEKLFVAYMQHDTFKRPSLSSTKHKLVSEKKTNFHRLLQGNSEVIRSGANAPTSY